jgi:hypothetical protein
LKLDAIPQVANVSQRSRLPLQDVSDEKPQTKLEAPRRQLWMICQQLFSLRRIQAGGIHTDGHEELRPERVRGADGKKPRRPTARFRVDHHVSESIIAIASRRACCVASGVPRADFMNVDKQEAKRKPCTACWPGGRAPRPPPRPPLPPLLMMSSIAAPASRASFTVGIHACAPTDSARAATRIACRACILYAWRICPRFSTATSSPSATTW